MRFAELTRTELRDLAPRATVVVPVGSTEQHGPHLPVCTDTAIVSAVAERGAALAAAHVPVVVLPALPFGFAHHHLPFGGTVSIGLSVYLDVLAEIGTSLVTDGFRRIVYLNGHGGNDAPIRAIGDRLVFDEGLDVHVAGTSYWTMAADALTELDLDVGPVPGHAGGFETSCLMALHPALVRTDHLPEPEDQWQPLASGGMDEATVRRPGLWEASDGRSDDSSRASREIGETIMATLAGRFGRFLVDFHRSSTGQVESADG